MSSGIPARDLLVQPTGQITTIWLIFFERLYSVYLQVEQSNIEGIEAVKKIANDAFALANQNKSVNDTQQNQINQILDAINGLIEPNQDIENLVAKVGSIEEEINILATQLNDLSKQFNSSNVANQQRFALLNQQISNLVQSASTKLNDAPVDGKLYGRKDATWYEVEMLSLYLPFFLSNGSSSNIPLTSDYQLPFFLANGTQQNIQMVTL